MELSVPVGQFRPCQEHVPESAKTRSGINTSPISKLSLRLLGVDPFGG